MVTFVTFAVPNVNKIIFLGFSTQKMSMENNLILTWHILAGRVIFASFSFVAPHTHMLSWAPNSCCSHSSVLSATESLDANWLCTSLSALPSCSQSLPSLAYFFHPYPGEIETFNFLASPASSFFYCDLVTAYPCSQSLSCLTAAHWEISNAAPCSSQQWCYDSFLF